jgi:outer membrane murein-binding lipoprotein Lpp
MTRAERLLYRRRHVLWIVAALLFLGGAVGVAFLQIHKEQSRADQLSTEADKRGGAVTTLATDVRTLRSQLQAAGKTPAAPDPAQAVKQLPQRAAVPVPIPGPPGPTGRPGKDAPTPTPSPGPSGAAGTKGGAGAPGADGQQGAQGPVGPVGPAGETGSQGPAGPAGADGKDGTNGADGKDGRDGQTCPDGYSLQTPPSDPDALECRRDSAPSGDSSAPTPQALGLDPRRQYP